MKKHASILLALLFMGLFAFSQTPGDVWNQIKEEKIPVSGTRYIVPNQYATFHLDLNGLDAILAQAPMEFSAAARNTEVILTLPMPDGSEIPFRIEESPIFEPAFGVTFPNIRTYNGVAVNDRGKYVRLDRTPQGFHAMILIAGESTVFIDPYSFGGGDIEHYIVYRKSDFRSSVNKMFSCDVLPNAGTQPGGTTAGRTLGSCDLRTYRLGISATGEYTAFHGGTVALAAAAQVTTMNRVNGVYERDMAIRMIIIGNNNNIIYTNGGTDPFTNGNPGSMINENVTNTNNVIGSANYDIGHVFGTNSGGLAGLGVVCSSSKARGVTGSGAPVGDPFDIDYVAHEMGHQFDCNHTQNNSCNRVNSTAWEPGSASTIMGYAGICAPNVQNNSDDHFHGGSLGEMGPFILGSGGSCANTITISNTAPTILSAPTGVTIPANTPFELTCVATDPDTTDVLTYCWEQMDNAVATMPPSANSTSGPAFRSNSPVTSPTRYFPNLLALLAGVSPTWEVLSNVTRTYNFRCFVRDNSPGAGCNDHVDVIINVDGNSGPFVVTYPSATGITWTGNTNETVTWNVNGTNAAPVSASQVDILLSTDGGLTFPTVLAANTPNDGSQSILVPNTPTNTARIKVIASNNVFFDVSDNNFVIVGASFDYTLNVPNTTVGVCAPADAVYPITIGSVGGYNDPVTLSVSGVPAGGTATFSTNPVTPAGSSNLTISNTGSIAQGTYTMTLTANSTSGPKTQTLTLIVTSPTGTVSLNSPLDGASGVVTPTVFNCASSPGAGVTYDIEVASDSNFTSIVDNATSLTDTTFTSSGLASSTSYYWRVRSSNACGTTAWSTVFTFTTNNCAILSSTNVPVAISPSGTPTITSTLNVSLGGAITDLNVVNLTGTHTWVSDLTVTLTGPTTASALLWGGICGSNDNFDLNFDDAGTPGSIPCPPTGGGTHVPTQPLSVFNGTNPNGTWTLTVADGADQDGGNLVSWGLQVCTLTDFTVNVPVPTDTVCSPTDASYGIDIGQAGTFTDPVTLSVTGLPGSATASFSTNPVTPVGSTTLTISNIASVPAGSYTLTLTATSTTGPKVRTLTLVVADPAPAAVTLTAPANTATSVAVPTNFTWTASASPGVTYEIDIATDAAFTSIVDNATGLATNAYTSTALSGATTYYWRVRAVSGCGAGPYATTFSFTTSSCSSLISTDVPISLPSIGTRTSTLTVSATGVITDINVINLTGLHNRIRHISITLTSPLGTTVSLFNQVCANENNWDLNLDDQAAPGALPCPPVGGGTYQPASPLSAFNGENPNGTWTLTVTDNVSGTSSTLTGWGLQVCTAPPCVSPDVPSVTVSSSTICNGDSTTLSIASGDLNGATAWNWYSASCGGTPVGTGNSLSVSPAATTDYFVRGEGGCATPASCATTTITVNPNYNQTASASVCPGDSYTFPDGSTQSNITATVTQTSVLATANLCDSTIVTTVTVNPTYNNAASASVCSGGSYTFPDGSTQNNITATVTQTSVLATANNCDSTIVTTVTINPSYNNTASAAVCSGDSYTFPDGSTQNNITATVTQTSVLATANNCDSTIVTTVTVNPAYNNTASATVCPGTSYTFPDGSSQTITATVTQTSVLATANNCDSTIVTTVNVYPTYNNTESASVCPGDSYTFPDGSTQTNITATVTYTSQLQTVAGCDSVIITTVSVNPAYNNTETATICTGSSYTFPDGTTQSNITATVTYTSQLQTAAGCDSVIVTTVNLTPAFNNTETASVCSGDSYTFPDGTTQSNITATVTYTSLLQTSGGCDSTIVTTVNVDPVYNQNETVSVCSGESYTFPDGTTQSNITATVTYTSQLQTAAGCDSVIVTTVNADPLPVVNLGPDDTLELGQTLTLDAGAGFTYLWGTGETTQTYVFDANTFGLGVHPITVTVTDGNGCTATDTVEITVIQSTGFGAPELLDVITVYPNPAEDYLIIDAEQSEVPVDEILLFNTLGQQIQRPEWSELNGWKIRLDLNGIARGVYYLKVRTRKGEMTEKVRIQ